MSRTADHSDKNRLLRETRIEVSSNNQIHLPGFLVKEIGFQSGKFVSTRGAKVGWYYHEGDDKAVLGDDTQRDSLELRGVASLAGVDNDDLDRDDVSGARITITQDLPKHIYEALTTSAQVVLRIHYPYDHPGLSSTKISVYPAAAYDTGELQNVEYRVEKVNEGSNELGSPSVRTYHKHSDEI